MVLVVVGCVREKRVVGEELEVIGCVKADYVGVGRLYVIGFLEVSGEVRVDSLYVVGGFRVRKLSVGRGVLFARVNSSIVEARAGELLVYGWSGGKVSIGDLFVDRGVVKWSYIHRVKAGRLEVYEGVVVDGVERVGELVACDPYISLRDTGGIEKVVLNYTPLQL